MDINEMKALPYDELRALYKNFLHSQNISQLTINTAYTDIFYLWRKASKDLFWNAVTSIDFENAAKIELIKALSENSTGNAKSLANSYLSHLRRFRLFLASDGTAQPSKPNLEYIRTLLLLFYYLVETLMSPLILTCSPFCWNIR